MCDAYMMSLQTVDVSEVELLISSVATLSNLEHNFIFMFIF